MPRHNREGHGSDQRGFEYDISYQPDWLRLVKVTRTLESGRKSSKTLFRNPSERQTEKPGERVRTRIVSPDQGLDFEVSVDDPHGRIRRIRITYHVGPEATAARGSMDPAFGEREGGDVELTLEDHMPPPNP